MHENNNPVLDVDRLRRDLKEELYGAYFGGGFGGAMIESFDLDRMTNDEVIQYAKNHGVRLDRYFV